MLLKHLVLEAILLKVELLQLLDWDAYSLGRGEGTGDLVAELDPRSKDVNTGCMQSGGIREHSALSGRGRRNPDARFRAGTCVISKHSQATDFMMPMWSSLSPASSACEEDARNTSGK